MSQKAASGLLGLAPSTVSDLLHRIVRRARLRHKIRGLKTLGVDEISYARGHRYATVVYDLDRSCVVWVGRGKARETIDQFFRQLSDYQKARIRWACCDMSEAFMGAIQQHCPQLASYWTDSTSSKPFTTPSTRSARPSGGRASAKDRISLKGLRWLLYRHASHRSRRDTPTLRALEKANRRIYRAWRLKDEFDQLWEYRARWAAERFLKRWTTTALKSRLEPLRKFVGTVRKHADGILAFVDTRLTNAVAEGLNRIIRMVKNRASGFRRLEAFADLIYLCVGDLDIPAQIPRRFRTL